MYKCFKTTPFKLNIYKFVDMKKIEFLNIDAGYRDFRALRNLGLDNVCLSLIAIKDNDA
jgi:hypothetical protein